MFFNHSLIVTWQLPLWPYLAIFSVRTGSTTCSGSTSPTLVGRSSSDSLLPSIPSCWISRSSLLYCRSCTACTTASSRQLTATTTSSGPTSTSKRSITSCWISRQGWFEVIRILSVHWKVISLRISRIALFLSLLIVSLWVKAGDTMSNTIWVFLSRLTLFSSLKLTAKITCQGLSGEKERDR